MLNQNLTFYEILNVHPTAKPEVIRKAYLNLARQNHPDKNINLVSISTENFQIIQQAYQTLSDPEKRKQYDEELEKGAEVEVFEVFCESSGENKSESGSNALVVQKSYSVDETLTYANLSSTELVNLAIKDLKLANKIIKNPALLEKIFLFGWGAICIAHKEIAIELINAESLRALVGMSRIIGHSVMSYEWADIAAKHLEVAELIFQGKLQPIQFIKGEYLYKIANAHKTELKIELYPEAEKCIKAYEQLKPYIDNPETEFSLEKAVFVRLCYDANLYSYDFNKILQHYLQAAKIALKNPEILNLLDEQELYKIAKAHKELVSEVFDELVIRFLNKKTPSINFEFFKSIHEIIYELALTNPQFFIYVINLPELHETLNGEQLDRLKSEAEQDSVTISLNEHINKKISAYQLLKPYFNASNDSDNLDLDIGTLKKLWDAASLPRSKLFDLCKKHFKIAQIVLADSDCCEWLDSLKVLDILSTHKKLRLQIFSPLHSHLATLINHDYCKRNIINFASEDIDFCKKLFEHGFLINLLSGNEIFQLIINHGEQVAMLINDPEIHLRISASKILEQAFQQNNKSEIRKKSKRSVEKQNTGEVYYSLALSFIQEKDAALINKQDNTKEQIKKLNGLIKHYLLEACKQDIPQALEKFIQHVSEEENTDSLQPDIQPIEPCLIPSNSLYNETKADEYYTKLLAQIDKKQYIQIIELYLIPSNSFYNEAKANEYFSKLLAQIDKKQFQGLLHYIQNIFSTAEDSFCKETLANFYFERIPFIEGLFTLTPKELENFYRSCSQSIERNNGPAELALNYLKKIPEENLTANDFFLYGNLIQSLLKEQQSIEIVGSDSSLSYEALDENLNKFEYKFSRILAGLPYYIKAAKHDKELVSFAIQFLNELLRIVKSPEVGSEPLSKLLESEVIMDFFLDYINEDMVSKELSSVLLTAMYQKKKSLIGHNEFAKKLLACTEKADELYQMGWQCAHENNSIFNQKAQEFWNKAQEKGHLEARFIIENINLLNEFHSKSTHEVDENQTFIIEAFKHITVQNKQNNLLILIRIAKLPIVHQTIRKDFLELLSNTNHDDNSAFKTKLEHQEQLFERMKLVQCQTRELPNNYKAIRESLKSLTEKEPNEDKLSEFEKRLSNILCDVKRFDQEQKQFNELYQYLEDVKKGLISDSDLAPPSYKEVIILNIKRNLIAVLKTNLENKVKEYYSEDKSGPASTRQEVFKESILKSIKDTIFSVQDELRTEHSWLDNLFYELLTWLNKKFPESKRVSQWLVKHSACFKVIPEENSCKAASETVDKIFNCSNGP